MFLTLGRALTAEAADDATFGKALVDFLATLARFDNCVAFAYCGDAKPIDLFDTFSPAQRRVHVTLYEPGPYLLDPFYTAASQRRLGFWRMRELAPDRFYQSDYYRTYYHETGLAEEVGFFAGPSPDTMVVLSLMRLKASGTFPQREITLLRQAEPTVTALLARHWRTVRTRFGAAAATAPPVTPDRSLHHAAWRDLSLTDREAIIVDLVLQGHSSESIAARLGIATGTVKVHRRNVYRKFKISSQTELLAIYVQRIIGSGLGDTPRPEPAETQNPA